MGAFALVISMASCAAQPPSEHRDTSALSTNTASDVSSAAPRPPYAWSENDAAFLQDIQRGAFNFFWNEAHPTTGLVPDRTGVTFASTAGVGFGLAAIPIAVERGWITRAEGHDRAKLVLSSLAAAPDNRHEGVFFHFLEASTAQPQRDGYEVTASTIDSSLLICGMIVASSYFGGDISALADPMIEGSNWSAYLARNPKEAHYRGFISLGWKAKDPHQPRGEGSYLPFYWADCGDEQRLVTFLAVGSADASKAVDPATYYKLRRRMGEYGDGEFAWFPWSGALFTSFFAHCWIDYASLGADNPAAHGAEHRPVIDWWENARRTALMHRRKAVENPRKISGLGENAWGLSACDGEKEYLVPGLYPRSVAVEGAVPERDYATYQPKDDWADGTIAPYSAGSSIMFLPREALAALRHYRSLNTPSGAPLLWSDPAKGGYGFFDSYNPASGWRAPGCVAIDQGPLILAIENARTGLIWNLFRKHPYIQRSMQRLGLDR